MVTNEEKRKNLINRVIVVNRFEHRFARGNSKNQSYHGRGRYQRHPRYEWENN